MDHAYPRDLAEFVIAHWSECRNPSPGALPPRELLEHLLSCVYQASLLREEERAVTFRLVLAEPEDFPAEHGPPAGLHRLRFARPRPLDEHELRRIAPAVKFHRSLIAVRATPEGALEIWGLVHSGPRWLRAVQGGRGDWPAMPPRLTVAVAGPGRVYVSKGGAAVGRIVGGRLSGPQLDAFDATWVPGVFALEREELRAAHAEARALAEARGERWATLDPEFVGAIRTQMLRRLISAVRNTHHGGALVLLPAACTARLASASPPVRLKYTFVDEEPRERIRTLVVRIMNTLAACHAGAAGHVGLREYGASTDAAIAALDEGVTEMSNLVAALADVDGVVVLSKRYDLLGFGGEIAGELGDVPVVARALDVEAERRELEPTDGVGTRHRSAYRLCNAHHDAIAIVVSQDGGARFIRWHEGYVTYWDQIVTGPLEY